MLYEVLSLFRAREPIPFLILAFLVVGWVIVFERAILLQLVYRINFKKFNGTLRQMLSANDTERARNFCAATSKTGLPHIAFKAIETYERDNFKVRMIVSEEAMSFFPRIRRRISQLPTLAACAVLLGAFASVQGVWNSFQVADGLELGLKSFAFTKGLSGALTPLALSLLASVLLMLPYALLDAIASRLENEMEHGLTMILNVLAPEMQPVFASHGRGGALANSSSGAVDTSSAKSAGSNDTKSESSSSNKGNYEEPSVSDRLDAVPDEEEII